MPQEQFSVLSNTKTPINVICVRSSSYRLTLNFGQAIITFCEKCPCANFMIKELFSRSISLLFRINIFHVLFFFLLGVLGVSSKSIVSKELTLINTPVGISKVELLLKESLMEIVRGDIKHALLILDDLIALQPNFRIAHLIKGDLLMVQAQRFETFGTPRPNSEDVSGYREEVKKRFQRSLIKNVNQAIPEEVLALNTYQSYILFVDTVQSRLFVFRNENGTPVYQTDYYITIGKNGTDKKSAGDKKTPIGLYFTAPKLDKRLDDVYGIAAYPLNYPNEWDRFLGKKGDGIWLHGTSKNTFSRPPNASDGCIVISNQDLERLAPILKHGNIPILISKQKTIKKNTISYKDDLLKAIEKWRSDWESQNTDAYLSYYLPDFFSKNMTYHEWVTYKKRIQANKLQIAIQLKNISMFAYPSTSVPVIVVTFDQVFKSLSLQDEVQKKQYWILENNQWRILYEGVI